MTRLRPTTMKISYFLVNLLLGNAWVAYGSYDLSSRTPNMLLMATLSVVSIFSIFLMSYYVDSQIFK